MRRRPMIVEMARYFTVHYPYADELTGSLMTRLIYLADWLSLLRDGQLLTQQSWRIVRGQPSLPMLYRDPFDRYIHRVASESGFPGRQIFIPNGQTSYIPIRLTIHEQQLLDQVIHSVEYATLSVMGRVLGDITPDRDGDYSPEAFTEWFRKHPLVQGHGPEASWFHLWDRYLRLICQFPDEERSSEGTTPLGPDENVESCETCGQVMEDECAVCELVYCGSCEGDFHALCGLHDTVSSSADARKQAGPTSDPTTTF